MNRTRVLVLLGALAFTAVVCAATEVTPENRGVRYDAAFYSAMAGHPEINPNYAHVGPWAYRVAVPAVAARLPWDTFTNFRVLSFVSTVATLFLMFLILEHLGFAASLCTAGVVLYACVFWAVRFACYAPAYIDAETQVMLLAIIYLTIRKQYLALIPVMIIAVLVKESLVALLPFVAVRLHRQHSGHVSARAGLIVAALVLAPLLAIAVVRALVMTVSAVDTSAEIREQLRLLMTPPYWAVLLHALFSGLGLVPLVIALRMRGAVAFAREHYEWIAYVLIATVLLFGGRDKGRLFLYMLPAMIVFAVRVIDDLGIFNRDWRGLAWLGVLVVAHAFIGNYLTPIGPEPQYLAKLAPEHAPAVHLSYLWRNLAIAAGFTAVTWALLWRKPQLSAQ